MLATVKITDNPIVTDTIVFDLPTPDANGCFLADPYKVNTVVIYYVERNFTNPNENIYKSVTSDATKLAAAEAAQVIACANPTLANIASAKQLQAESISTSTITPFYFNEARPIKVIGNNIFPAWLSTDQNNAFIDHHTLDANFNTISGNFSYSWDTRGVREGDYFICWTWTPLPAGDAISQHLKFSLGGNTVVTTSIPTHYTVPDKYETLLERYLPEMFKMNITDTDRTPDILQKFNQAIAEGFTALENLANQLVDLQDANSTHELFLPLLANFFGLKLKTNDPTLWRRQIKNAIRLYKKKGTRKGLEEALSQANIKMTRLTRLWQIISSYTWEETFIFKGPKSTWLLSKVALPIDPNNFGLWLRPVGEEVYLPLSANYVSTSTSNGLSTITWAGSGLLTNPIDLIDGDIIRILYQYNVIPDSPHQSIENYIRSLPLADQRDERRQAHPPKNWNIHVIEEDDPLLEVVIPSRHPYHEFLVFGKIRTEFPYSENAYNADEYNGSIRSSKNPCDIDKDFLDPCTACLGSKFTIDVEIENLSNDRILETQDVVREFSPFHAVLHTMNFMGGITEFVIPPIEEVEVLVNIAGEDFVIAGEGQMWFNRAMKRGTTTEIIDRSDLATSNQPISGAAGIAYNDNITIFSPDVRFDLIGMEIDGMAILEILAPSPNAGTINLSSPYKNTAVASSAIEPLNTAAFTFRVSNILSQGTLCNITQDNVYGFTDVGTTFPSVKTLWDVQHDGAVGSWKVSIPAYSAIPYSILNILSDGTLSLQNNLQSLPNLNITNISYTLLNENNTTIHSGTTGSLVVTLRGRVEVLSVGFQDVRKFIRGTCYLVVPSGQFQINGFVEGTTNSFYTLGYTAGDMAGTNLKIYQRLTDNQIGYLSHRGLELQTTGNLESSLGIQNGANMLTPINNQLDNDNFMENFLVTINSQDYFISNINGNSPIGNTTITLSGPDNYWKTLGAGGTAVNFTITHFTRKPITITGQQFDLPPHTFRTYDRYGREVITDQINTNPPMSVPLMPVQGSVVNEIVTQKEGVNFEIEWLDGSKEQGDI